MIKWNLTSGSYHFPLRNAFKPNFTIPIPKVENPYPLLSNVHELIDFISLNYFSFNTFVIVYLRLCVYLVCTRVYKIPP